jgi:GT2 family glycosyltransferase
LGGLLGHPTALGYRAVSAVYVQVNRPRVSPHHWIYFMDGDCVINRLCEVKNMDPALGPEDSAVVCCEVTNREPGFVDKTVQALVDAGLVKPQEVLDTTEVTREYSYPVYACNYERDVDAAMGAIGRYTNLYTVGRAAQFEHMEIDDCYAAAEQCAREIVRHLSAPIEVKATRRSSLPVEPSVVCVLLEARDRAHTLDALASLCTSDYGQREVLLVASTNGGDLERLVAAEYPEVRFVARSAGMAAPSAFNLGCSLAAQAGADFVFVALGSCTVAPDMLSCLVKVAQRDPGAGILAPKILCHDKPDHIWSTGSYFRSFPPSIKTIGLGRRDDARFSEPREVEFAASAGLLVRTEALERTGVFDPGYEYYYEDIDLSQRVRNEGFRVRYVPEARMYHRSTAAPSDPDAYYLTWGHSFARYYRRHMKPLVVKLPWHLAYLLLREALTGNAPRTPALLRGVLQGLQERLGPIPTLDRDFAGDAVRGPPGSHPGAPQGD